MKKIIMISLGFTLISYGMSYKKFKQYTLAHAKVLKSQSLSLQTRKEKNDILLRSRNPSINIETSRFNIGRNNYNFGYSTIVSQSIRTSNFYNGQKDLTKSMSLLEEAYVIDGKAGYIKTLEKIYTEYVYQSKLLALLKKEYKLSNKVTKIVQERYENGSENKVAYLQAKTNTISLKTQMYSTKQAMSSSYYQLLAIAGLKKKVSLSQKFIYPVSTKITSSKNLNPKQKVLDAKLKVLESKVFMNDSSIERFELYGGIEDESTQSILRVGVNISLPIFNNKSEEKRLTNLKKQQLSLDREQLSIDTHTKNMMLKYSIGELREQYYALKALKKEQETLNRLLQDGYKISQGSMFIMMNSQNRLIQTQKSLLQTQKMINNQKIELRFIQGQYND